MRRLEAFGFLVERMTANVLNIVLPKLFIMDMGRLARSTTRLKIFITRVLLVACLEL